jgi:hypothetical protein
MSDPARDLVFWGFSGGFERPISRLPGRAAAISVERSRPAQKKWPRGCFPILAVAQVHDRRVAGLSRKYVTG